jgi:ArsR family transcriptional regulator, lead/cadmium/zinc/bismuth-responsive transcriptional repressor
MKRAPVDLNPVEVCEARVIHCDVVQRVKNKMPAESDLEDLAGFYKLFGDPTRISILWALSESEMCVCDICALLGMKQPAVSHQLKTLKQGRVVRSRREGKVVYYSLDDDHIRSLLHFGLDHLRESEQTEKTIHARY